MRRSTTSLAVLALLLAFSASAYCDESTLITRSRDGTPLPRACQPGISIERLTSSPFTPIAPTKFIAFSPDESLVATSSMLEHVANVQLWDSHTGTLVKSLQFEEAYCAAGLVFSSDGRLLAAATESGIHLVWNLNTFERLSWGPAEENGDLIALAFSAVNTNLHSIYVTDSSEDMYTFSLETPGFVPVIVDITSDEMLSCDSASGIGLGAATERGGLILGTRLGRIVQVEESGAIERLMEVEAPSDDPNQWEWQFRFSHGSDYAAWSPHKLLLGDIDGTARRIDAWWGGHGPTLHEVSLSPDASLMAMYRHHWGSRELPLIEVRDTNSGALRRTLTGFNAGVSAVRISAQNQFLGIVSFTGKVSIWELPDGVLKEYCQTPASLNSLSFADGGRLLCGSGTNECWLWDVADSRQRLMSLSSAKAWLCDGGESLATLEPDGHIVFRDPETGTIQSTVSLRGAFGLLSETFSARPDVPRAEYVDVAADNRTVAHLQHPSGVVRIAGQSDKTHDVKVEDPATVHLSPRGDSVCIYVWSEPRPVVILIEATTGATTTLFDGQGAESLGCLLSVEFLQEGSYVALLYEAFKNHPLYPSQHIEVRNAIDGEIDRVIEIGETEFRFGLEPMATSHGSSLILVGRQPGTVMGIDASTGQVELLATGLGGEIDALACSSDGKLCAASSANGAVFLIKLERSSDQ